MTFFILNPEQTFTFWFVLAAEDNLTPAVDLLTTHTRFMPLCERVLGVTRVETQLSVGFLPAGQPHTTVELNRLLRNTAAMFPREIALIRRSPNVSLESISNAIPKK